jgi:hypothetical protein
LTTELRTWHLFSAPNEIRVSSVHRFKGLESKVVLLVEEPKGFTPNLVPILYIACSRAMTHLVRFSQVQKTENTDG